MIPPIQDIYNPLERYRDEFRGVFEQKITETFDDFVSRSGVDVIANRKTADEIRRLSSLLNAEKTQHSFRIFYIVLTSLAILASAIFSIYSYFVKNDTANSLLGIAGFISTLIILLLLAIPAYNKTKYAINQYKAQLSVKKVEGFQQLAPLQQFFEWDTIQRVIEMVVPRIHFDSYVTENRIQELHDSFGLDDSFNDQKSVLSAQSGEINGNPFIFGKLLSMEWGLKSYSGFRTVSWSETIIDGDGKKRRIKRFQTLTATVTKPFPKYSTDEILLFGNDAAPNLSFSRSPSSLSGNKEGFFNKQALKREIKKLEKFSRNLDDDSDYTIMGNREFEAIFHATDRTNEQEFRLLYTPLAQIQTLSILHDTKVGYGDDFSFIKLKKMNVIRAEHLSASDLDTDPQKFVHYDLDTERACFIRFAIEFFKSTYFSLAPLLAIPLYQQTRTHQNIYGTSVPHSSFWEHESLANYLGEERFSHPQSVTTNILKTTISECLNGISLVAVTAHGFKIVRRTDSIPIMANNGQYYNVNVEWDEYIAVRRTSPLRLSEQSEISRKDFNDGCSRPDEMWQDFFRRLKSKPSATHFRRNILSD